MIKIVLGLIGLCVVVVVHEFGHFIAAKLCGVTVESFSVGWGPVLLKKKKGQTEYRLSAIPLGGYCGMKGGKDIQIALDSHKTQLESEPDSFYGVSPFARIFIAFLGPFFNVLFALLAIICIQGIGYTKESYDNKIVLASDFGLSADAPANAAGLQTGDIITAVNGTAIQSFSDIQEYIGSRPEKTLDVTVLRAGNTVSAALTPQLDPDTGIGKIGIYPWIEPTVMNVKENSAAYIAGIKKGDRIIAINRTPVQHVIEFQTIMDTNKRSDSIAVTVERDGNIFDIAYVPQFGKNNEQQFGIVWTYKSYTEKSNGFIDACADGFFKTVDMIQSTVQGLGLLFKGVNLKNAVSGPVRITYMLGDIAKSGFSAGIQQGFVAVLSFLSLISISLFLMNLLPIPILDGGTIFLSFAQLVFRKKSVSPKFLYYFQMVGAAVIMLLFVFAIFNDISFFVRN